MDTIHETEDIKWELWKVAYGVWDYVKNSGKLPALCIEPSVSAFGVEQLQSDYERPFIQSNAWGASSEDPAPYLHLKWAEAKLITKVVIYFDVDYDHAMESVQWHHSEDAMPFCVKRFRLLNAQGDFVAEQSENHLGRVEIKLDSGVKTHALRLECKETHGAPASVFSLQVF